jgi:hypothetical protein
MPHAAADEVEALLTVFSARRSGIKLYDATSIQPHGEPLKIPIVTRTDAEQVFHGPSASKRGFAPAFVCKTERIIQDALPALRTLERRRRRQ